MKPFAKNLRRNQTDAERRMWRYLKSRALAGFKFRRQCPIGSYIVDFVCFEKMVVIEIDGGRHAEQLKEDARRTAYLKYRGFEVLRFWNNEVMANTDSVLSVILITLVNTPSSPTVPAGVRENPAHPFDGADVHRKSATTPSHLPEGEGSIAVNAHPESNTRTAEEELLPLPSGRGRG